MQLDEETLRAVETNAELVRSMARERLGQDVGFDESGVTWLDGFVQRMHESGDPDLRSALVSRLGSYLGKCIIETYGGRWARVDGVVCVAFDEENRAYPFAKMEKHLENGHEDSVHSFFTVLPLLFDTKLGKRAEVVHSSVVHGDED